MQKSKRLLALFFGIFMICPYIYGFPPKLIQVPESGLARVISNQPLPTGEAPRALGAAQPIGEAFRPPLRDMRPPSPPGSREPGILRDSPFRWTPEHPPTPAEMNMLYNQAMRQYYESNPGACTLL